MPVSDVQECPSEESHVVNSFGILVAIRERRLQLFWAVGSDNYTRVFRIIHSEVQSVQLEEVVVETLRYECPLLADNGPSSHRDCSHLNDRSCRKADSAC